MNPFITVWTKPKETLDNIKDTNWVNRAGWLPYLAGGINAVAESPEIFAMLDIQNWFLQMLWFVALAIIPTVLLRVIYVNLFFYIGKSLEGQATKRHVDTLLSLTMIPEFFKLAYLMRFVLAGSSLENFQSSYVLYFICSAISLIIAIIGLRHIQKFAYKYVLLNIFMPMVLFTALVFMIL